MLACLVTLRPLLSGTNERATLTLCSVSDRRVTTLGGVPWEPCITQAPAIGMQFWNGDFEQGTEAGKVDLTFNLEQARKAFPSVIDAIWMGAEVEIAIGTVGTPAPWKTRFKGRVSSYAGGQYPAMKISASVDTEPFDVDTLNRTYAGTTGSQGSADLKGKVKPLALGRPRNVEPVLINAIDSVYQFSAYGPIEGVEVLYERASAFPSSIGNYATYAALVAATIKPGQWATCNAEGLVRLGAPAAGVITGDIRGHVVGGAAPRGAGALVKLLVSIAGVSTSLISTAKLDALDATASTNCDVMITDQVTLLEAARRIILPCNWQVVISNLGILLPMKPVISSSASLVVHTQGKREPLCGPASEEPVSFPYKKTTMAAARAWRVHTLDEIASDVPLIDRGDYDDAIVYREGNIVKMPGGSRWKFVSSTPKSGITPGTDPDVWETLESGTTYADGTPIDDLKPAQPGADVTGENTSKDTEAVGGKPATEIVDQLEQQEGDLDQLAIDTATVKAAVATAQTEITGIKSTAAATKAALEGDIAAINLTTSQIQADATQVRQLLEADIASLEAVQGTITAQGASIQAAQADIITAGGRLSTLESTQGSQAASISSLSITADNHAGRLASSETSITALRNDVSQAVGLDFSKGWSTMTTLGWGTIDGLMPDYLPIPGQSIAAVPGEGKAVQSGPGTYMGAMAKQYSPITDGHQYEMALRAITTQADSGGVEPLVYAGLQLFNAAGILVARWYAIVQSPTVAQGWQDYTRRFTKAMILAESGSPDFAYVSIMFLLNYRDNYPSLDSQQLISRLAVRDITAEQALSARITTNATAISNTDGQVASLTTQVGAQGSLITQNATAISTVSGDLASLSSTVGTQGASIAQNASALSGLSGDLATLGNTVATQGSNISTLQQSVTTVEGSIATLRTDLSAQPLTFNRNAAFFDWPTGSRLPARWVGFASDTGYKVSGFYGGAVEIDNLEGQENGIVARPYLDQSLRTIVPSSWVVLEADIEFLYGQPRGSGFLVQFVEVNDGPYRGGASIIFEEETSGIFALNRRYQLSKLVRVPDYPGAPATLEAHLHGISGWLGFTQNILYKRMRFYRLGLRAATVEEIELNKPLGVKAQVSTNAQAISTAQGTLASLENTVASQGANISTLQSASSTASVDIAQLKTSVTATQARIAQTAGVNFGVGFGTMTYPEYNILDPNYPSFGNSVSQIVSVPSEGKVLQVGPGGGSTPGSALFVGRQYLKLEPGKKYEARARARTIQDATNGGYQPAVYIGINIYNQNGDSIGRFYLSVRTDPTSFGWYEHNGATTTADILASHPSASYISPLVIINYRDEQFNLNSIQQMSSLTLRDVTVEHALSASINSNATAIATAQGSLATLENTVSTQGSSISSLQTTASTQSGDIASLKIQMAAGSGGNLLENTDFYGGGDFAPWLTETYNLPADQVTYMKNIAGSGYTVPGADALGIRQNADAQNCYMRWMQFLPVEAGKYYDVSCWHASHRASVGLYLVFYDLAGAYITEVNLFPPMFQGGGQSLDQFQRISFRAPAPANAVKALFIFHKQPSLPGSGDSYAWMIRPQVKLTSAASATPLPYSSGSARSVITQQADAVYSLNGDYASLSSTVSTQGASISSNSTAISGLQSTSASLSATVSAHDASIGTNASAISSATGRVATLENTVSTQGVTVSQLSSASSTQAGKIAMLENTVSAQGATVSQHTSAISTAQSGVNTALARAAVRLDVNGYVTGWEANNNGSVGSLIVNADHFAIVKPGGGAGLTWSSANGGTLTASDGQGNICEMGYLA